MVSHIRLIKYFQMSKWELSYSFFNEEVLAINKKLE